MRVAIVPAAPGLLSQYAGRIDPLAEVRDHAAKAVSWLLEPDDGAAPPVASVQVVCSALTEADRARGIGQSQGERLAVQLLAGCVPEIRWAEPATFELDRPTLILADGSARRSEKAPGHLDERSFAFDEAIEKALTAGDGTALAALDLDLADELLAGGASALRRLGVLAPRAQATLDHADDPFGVQYWVARWLTASEGGGLGSEAQLTTTTMGDRL